MRTRHIKALAAMLALLAASVLPAAAQPAEPPYRLFLPLTQTSAQVWVLRADADAFVFESGPNDNTGGDPALYVGNDQDPESRLGTMRALIHFNLPPVPPSAVKRAILRVYYAGYADFPNQGRSLMAYRVGQPWAESSVTWANQPVFGDPSYPFGIYSNEPFGYKEVDVTGQTQRMLENPSANYGFIILGEEWSDERWSYRVFASRETEYPPQLVIEQF